MSQPARSSMPVTDDWRRWIAENLVLDAPPKGLYDVMLQNGIAPEEADLALQQAMAHPFMQGARQAGKRMTNRLRKHDWVLDIYRTLNRQTPGSDTIPRRHKLTRDEFYRDYYLLNKPVIITGMMEDWPAMRRWNLDYFRSRFGDRVVEVQTGRERDTNYEINCVQHKQKMPLAQYIDMIESVETSNDFYMTANNTSDNRKALNELWQDMGRLPEYLNPQSNDDGFFWLGPKGIRTPYHHDLTNNFMAQVMGRKRIRLIPACEIAYVYNHYHCYTPVDGYRVDYEKFPMMRNVQILECEIGPGEILFLPVGCWHYVEGLEISSTVSLINFLPDNNYAAIYSTYQDV